MARRDFPFEVAETKVTQVMDYARSTMTTPENPVATSGNLGERRADAPISLLPEYNLSCRNPARVVHLKSGG
jgi:hypothetical protein